MAAPPAGGGRRSLQLRQLPMGQILVDLVQSLASCGRNRSFLKQG